VDGLERAVGGPNENPIARDREDIHARLKREVAYWTAVLGKEAEAARLGVC
jgi:hypothetical protein